MSKQAKSMYNSLDEMEEELSVKKIGAEAQIFYMDKSKDLKERIKVFEKYGHEEGSIYTPDDDALNVIFEFHNDDDNNERHQTYETIDIIDWWIGMQKRNRVNVYKGEYSPKFKKLTRNYTPNKQAIERLRIYYIEKLFIEGISSFVFDW